MLTTLSRLKEILGIPEGETTQNARLTGYISAASEMIETYCERQFERKERRLTLPDFDGRHALLRAYPVTVIKSVKLDGTAVTGWFIDRESGILTFPRDLNGAISLIYTGGYTLPGGESAPDLPAPLQFACELLTQTLIGLEDNGGQGATQERIGDYSISYGRNVVGSGAGSGSEGGLLFFAPAAAAIVRPYIARWVG